MAFIESSSMIGFGNVGDTCNFGKHQVKNESPWAIPCTIVNRDETKGIMTLMADNIIDLRAFDAKEPNNSDSNRKSYGNNQWRYSNIRQWLNSADAAGSWYTAQHSADAPPNSSNVSEGTPYQDRPGFLYNFSSEDRALLKVSTITTNLPSTDGGSQNTTSDMVFLPSIKNLGGSQGTDEDETFQLYEGAQNANRVAHMHASAFSNTSSNSKPSSATAGWYYWTRSPNVSNSHSVWYVLSVGSFDSSHGAYSGHCGVRPCFSIAIAAGVSVIDKFMVLPAATSITYLSPVRTLTGPAKNIAIAVDCVYEGSFVSVYACNNAYDASPTWEDVTTYVSANSIITLNNSTKTADNWGLQVKVVINKEDAPYISSRGIAYVVLDESVI